MSFADDPFPSGWEIATNNYLVSSESSSEDVFGSLDLDLGTDKVFFYVMASGGIYSLIYITTHSP